MTSLKTTHEKILSLEALSTLRGEWLASGEKVVFTNGCFDILHKGHVVYLEAAKNLGTKLILGLNSDTSVQRLKGPNRPIQDEESRAFVMAALECIDAVVLFGEDTPLHLIENLSPDILAKGGDYTIKTIVGANQVLSKGGQVEVIPFIDGYSTSNIESKIKESDRK